jgi:hypothetical protein
VRTRSALLAATLLAGVAALPAAHAATVVSRPDACTVGYAAPTGDAPVLYAVPNDADLDVTHVTWQVGPADVVVTAVVAKLADRPATAWGDEFDAVVTDRVTGQQVTFGYFRTPSGGGPVFYGGKVPQRKSAAGFAWNAYPGGPTQLVTDFDVARSQVVITIPRADLARAFGTTFGKLVLTGLGVNTYALDAAYDPMMSDFGKAALDPKAVALPAIDCDRWRAKRGPKPPAPSPCVVEFAALTGDETSRTSDVVPTRDDSVDVARVTYRLTAKDLLVTVRVSRLTDHPLFGTGQGYSALFAYRGAVAQFGVTRDAVDGTKVRQYGGTTVSPLTVVAAFDQLRQSITLTIPRAAVATAFGLKDTRALVVTSPAANAFWTLNGQSVSTADGDASAGGRTLSFPACDKSLAHH